MFAFSLLLCWNCPIEDRDIMNYKPLILSLYQIGAIKFGDFTLKSGKKSTIYLDLRQIVSFPDILQEVAEAIWQQISQCPIDVICGVPYTALPIATCISLKQKIPMVMRRKEQKEYGTKQRIEGTFKMGQQCAIIEDIITTGSSILETAEDIESAGLQIQHVGVLINREQGGEKNLHQHQYQLHSAFTLKEGLSTLLTSNVLPEFERNIVNTLLHENA
ncbi:MAG: pyrE [Gammaproteobacteria bacterium]|jgi:uridine monophosphate synthetase|nr:pyrE [Gammaproteobacteria bacterium]